MGISGGSRADATGGISSDRLVSTNGASPSAHGNDVALGRDAVKLEGGAHHDRMAHELQQTVDTLMGWINGSPK